MLYVQTTSLCLPLVDANNDNVTAKAVSKIVLEAVVLKQDWQSGSGINISFVLW